MSVCAEGRVVALTECICTWSCLQMCDIGCCVCMCSKAGDRCSERSWK